MKINDRPVILALCSYYLPGYKGGGPIRTIANAVQRLGDEFNFKIITIDRDLGDHHPYSNVTAHAWNACGKGAVYYVGPGFRGVAELFTLMRRTHYDVLYLNSFFAIGLSIAPLVLRWLRLVPRKPVILAPRGEFSKGALGIKPLKKSIYMCLSKSVGLLQQVSWHASTDAEAQDIRRVIGPASAATNLSANDKSIHVAADLAAHVAVKSTFSEHAPGSLRVCFLSRIARMKNLDFALHALVSVKSNVDFDIYGPLEDADYWAECELLMPLLPQNVHVRYCGCVAHADVCDLISKYELFFVPSRGENFGHVFIEALSSGVPILVSDQTPWRDLSIADVGRDLPLTDTEGFAKIIDEYAAMTAADYKQLRMRCVDYARKTISDASHVLQNRMIFRRALVQGSGVHAL